MMLHKLYLRAAIVDFAPAVDADRTELVVAWGDAAREQNHGKDIHRFFS